MFSPPINQCVLVSSAKAFVVLFVCIAASGCGQLETASQVYNSPEVAASSREIQEPVAASEQSPVDEILKDEFDREEQLPKKPKPAITAEAYLKQFDDPSRRYLDANLPAAELEKVAAELQARFPLQSLRARLHFQTKAPSSHYSPGWDDRRTSALARLHSENVNTFISGEGQGIGRISPISPSDLRPRGSNTASTKLAVEEVGSDLLGEPRVELDPEFKTRRSRAKMTEGELFPDPDHYTQLSENGLPKQQLVSEFNRRANERFSGNLGLVKNLDQVAGFATHNLKMPKNWDQNLRSSMTYAEQANNDAYPNGPHWKVNRLQLVSLLMHEQPAVYVTDELPNMESLSSEDAETRGLSAFETDGLEKLQAGESLYIQATRNRIAMMGAVRASEECRQCHAVKKDELLGAFSYEFLRSPRLNKNPNE